MALCFESTASTIGGQHWRSGRLLQSVVLIEAINADSSWGPYGTGVFVDIDSSLDHVFVLTNRHIYMGRDSLRLVFRRYVKGDGSTTYKERRLMIRRESRVAVPSTSDSDFVAIFINRPPDSLQYRPVPPDFTVELSDLDYGEDVIFFGYPNYEMYGFYKGKWDLPVVRSGTIAYFAQDDVTLGGQKVMMAGMFLIDGVSMGGNSGGPVFIKRPRVSKGFKITYDMRLAGIIQGHLPAPRLTTLPLSEIPALSKLLENVETPKDSIYMVKFLSDYQMLLDENSDLAKVISFSVLRDFIYRSVLEGKGLTVDSVMEMIRMLH